MRNLSRPLWPAVRSDVDISQTSSQTHRVARVSGEGAAEYAPPLGPELRRLISPLSDVYFRDNERRSIGGSATIRWAAMFM